MRWVVAPVAVAAVAVALGGCGGGGGGDSKSNSTTSTATETSTPAGEAPATETNTPTIEEPGAAEATSNVDKVRKALEDSGNTVEDDEVSGTAEASLRIGATSIVFYKNTADASDEGASIKKVFNEHPSRGVARIKDTRVYYMGQERKLTAAERAKFAKIVSAAEAALK